MAWKVYVARKQVTQLENDQRALVTGMYANGNMEQRQLTDALNRVTEEIVARQNAILAVLHGEELGSTEIDEEENVDTEWW